MATNVRCSKVTTMAISQSRDGCTVTYYCRAEHNVLRIDKVVEDLFSWDEVFAGEAAYGSASTVCEVAWRLERMQDGRCLYAVRWTGIMTDWCGFQFHVIFRALNTITYHTM
jgi:hypothetical protein